MARATVPGRPWSGDEHQPVEMLSQDHRGHLGRHSSGRMLLLKATLCSPELVPQPATPTYSTTQILSHLSGKPWLGSLSPHALWSSVYTYTLPLYPRIPSFCLAAL